MRVPQQTNANTANLKEQVKVQCVKTGQSFTINDNDMLSYSPTTMMCLMTKVWYGFPAYTVNLFIKVYQKITYKEDLKITYKRCVLEMICFSLWFFFYVFFTIDHLKSISFFCQNAHRDRLTKENISNWFLVFLYTCFIVKLVEIIEP